MIIIVAIIIIIIIMMIIIHRFDKPHDVFEGDFSMKTINVSDEISSIVSCTVRNKMKICNK